MLIRSHESSVASMLVTHGPLRSILIHKPIIQGLVKVPKTIPRLSSLDSKKKFWLDIDILKLCVHILRPYIDILRPDNMAILSPDNNI